MDSTKDNYSKKFIGILINTRYVRLIHAYYIFFKNIQKSKKLKKNITRGQFGHTTFHTIYYYNKILIQFIYLSYFKNDLVKIGESILNYLEFLIKFKFKTSQEEQYILDLENKDKDEYFEKIEAKKNTFKKILKWFNLFDDYISFVKRNSRVDDIKSIV